MRLASFELQGKPGFGAVVDGGVVDLTRHFATRYPDLKSVLAAAALPEIAAYVAGKRADLPVDDVAWAPVIPKPDKIWCCGLNYREHVRETGNAESDKPVFFTRFANSQVGHEGSMPLPRESTKLDYEGEIAVVIGRPGRRIPESQALDFVAGYACYNDGSVRDWQRHSSQWGPGKNFAQTGGFGPWMVTADEIPPGTIMTLATRLNGQEMQRATTDLMIHTIARQIAYLSIIAPLEPGDVIVTGTPGGVGARREPAVWMRPGDVVEVEVDRIGVLRNHVVSEP
jgi:2-keto-4-pentenoate hydratase/2-oxohepta-3-ene-1,7-dioic acid hydratase in catechol pathway